MVRTKQTTPSRGSNRPNQGEVAYFEPRENAAPPNQVKCSQCDRCFSNISNLKRHERQTHGEALFKYPCPQTPTRSFVRRHDLRIHYQAQHPDQDQDEIDEVDPVETPKVQQKRASSEDVGESSAGSNPPKKKKEIKVKSNPEAVSSESGCGSGVLSTSELNKFDGAAGRLIKIEETVKIERVYYFER